MSNHCSNCDNYIRQDDGSYECESYHCDIENPYDDRCDWRANYVDHDVIEKQEEEARSSHWWD